VYPPRRCCVAGRKRNKLHNSCAVCRNQLNQSARALCDIRLGIPVRLRFICGTARRDKSDAVRRFYEKFFPTAVAARCPRPVGWPVKKNPKKKKKKKKKKRRSGDVNVVRGLRGLQIETTEGRVGVHRAASSRDVNDLRSGRSRRREEIRAKDSVPALSNSVIVVRLSSMPLR